MDHTVGVQISAEVIGAEKAYLQGETVKDLSL